MRSFHFDAYINIFVCHYIRMLSFFILFRVIQQKLFLPYGPIRLSSKKQNNNQPRCVDFVYSLKLVGKIYWDFYHTWHQGPTQLSIIRILRAWWEKCIFLSFFHSHSWWEKCRNIVATINSIIFLSLILIHLHFFYKMLT